MSHYVGQTFEGKYPPSVAIWCNNNNNDPGRTHEYTLQLTGDNWTIISTPIVRPTLLKVSSDKKQEAMDAFDKASESLVPFYSDKEVATFYKQEKEAITWHEGVQSGTVYTDEELLSLFPFIYSLAISRGVPFVDLANKILIKVAQIATVNGTVLGAKQNVEDEVDKIVAREGTIEEIQAIDVLNVFNVRVAAFGFSFDEQYNITSL